MEKFIPGEQKPSWWRSSSRGSKNFVVWNFTCGEFYFVFTFNIQSYSMAEDGVFNWPWGGFVEKYEGWLQSTHYGWNKLMREEMEEIPMNGDKGLRKGQLFQNAQNEVMAFQQELDVTNRSLNKKFQIKHLAAAEETGDVVLQTYTVPLQIFVPICLNGSKPSKASTRASPKSLVLSLRFVSKTWVMRRWNMPRRNLSPHEKHQMESAERASLFAATSLLPVCSSLAMLLKPPRPTLVTKRRVLTPTQPVLKDRSCAPLFEPVQLEDTLAPPLTWRQPSCWRLVVAKANLWFDLHEFS